MATRPETPPAKVGRRVARLVDSVPPAAGAVVMGTGIVSIDLTLDGQGWPSLVPLVIATLAWVLLGLLLTSRYLGDRARFDREAAMPTALTSIAGTAVLGIRLALLGWSWAAQAMLVIATLLWLLLVGRVLRRWVTPTVGASFILTVATESLAVLLAVLGLSTRTGWLVVLAVVPLALGVGFYVFVVLRFPLRQLLVGRGDHWVSGGALAISTLACGRTAEAARELGLLGGGALLRPAALLLWVLALAWLPALVVAELARPRLLYDTRRWSTVFPVGMYAACSFITGGVIGIAGLTTFSRVWTWVAVAVWVVVLAAMVWQPIPVLLGRRPGDTPAGAGVG